ncbi:putative reverse transcriptase domain-containing protein [Tanacetum coccineum]
MPPKSAPLTQAVVWRMIKESVDAAIVAERVRHANAGNDARGDKKAKFSAATLEGPALTWMVEPESVKVDAYIRGLSENIKGEVISSRPANLNEVVCMAHKLMEQKSQARDERILEGKKLKWENFQSGNNSGKSNHKDNSRQYSQNNQNQGNAQERKCGKVGRSRGIEGKGVLPRCATLVGFGLAMIVGSKGLNVVTGTFLLNNCYASVLFDSGSDRSFVDTRFSSMLNIETVKISASYEVELADERVVSTNTVLKGYTLNLVNHLFEIDLMPIELGTFDVIIGMDWLVKRDADACDTGQF